MDFTGKKILVVGGSSGIGFETCRLLLQSGAEVWNMSRRQPTDLAVRHIPFDVLNFQENAFSEIDTLHGLVYCVGSINLKPFNRLKKEDFLQDYHLNVLGAVQTIQSALPALRKGQQASIVLFSTVAVGVGMGFHASVAAAKGAVEGLVRSLAAEFAPYQIRCNAIAPSLTDTPLAQNLLSTEEKRQAAAKRHPLNKIGTAQDLAQMTTFLLSDQSAWVTGQIIGVDGGLSSLRV